MNASEPEAREFLPLSNLSFHIMLALGDAPAHGYAIGKEVESRSHGKLKPTTGGLYQALRRLVEDGLVQHAPAEDAGSPDRRRKHFRLTRLGRRVAALEAGRLDQLVSVARERKLFGGAS